MILSIIYFILILGTIVLVHEFGHFFFSKLFGVYVYEFSIGMGPKIFGKKKGETEYSIRAFPIGGYCSLAGESDEDDKKVPKKRLLQSKKVWQRALIMFFGAGNNFILALIVLFSLGLIIGSPSNTTIIKEVQVDSPAYIAGILAGDKITKVNGNTVKTLDDLQLYVALAEGDTDFTVYRNDEEITITVTPLSDEEASEKGYTYGFSYDNTYKKGVIPAIKYAFNKFYSLVRQICITFKELFKGGVKLTDLSGPVGIYQAVDQTKSSGIANLFYLMALLSINVGFVNLIPFPAFDGGRILFLIIEKIRGKQIKPEVENLINNIGFFILIGLVLLVTGSDIIKMIKG